MDTDKLFKELAKELKEINKANRQSRQQNRGYNTTRFTTPDVAGFRAFFSTAIGDSFIDAVEDEGFLGALDKGLNKIFGTERYEEINKTAEAQLKAIDKYRASFISEIEDLLKLGDQGLPGGITAQTAFRRIAAYDEAIDEPMRRNVLEDAMRSRFANVIRQVRTFTTAIVGATAALVVFRESLYKEAQQIGGVSLDQALQNRIGRFIESFQSIFTNRGLVLPGRIAEVQGAVAGEFGRVISPEAATQLAQTAQTIGVGVDKLVALERALQGTGYAAEDTVNQFKAVGIGGQIAAQELAKNADAVARAGGNFNEYIVQGIANAKRLGLEFDQIEQTLTGFSTDFEGTITRFSELRAVLPGFATDFEQLMGTALYGTPEEYIEQIRSSLLGAGMTTTAGVSRTVLAELEKATSFSASQIQRILEGEDPYVNEALVLDTDRNQILNKIYAAVAGIAGVVGGAALGKWLGGIVGGALGTFIAPGVGTAAGAGLGSTIGSQLGRVAGTFGGAYIGGMGAYTGSAYIGNKFDDFVFRPGQPPAKFSPNDTLIGVKDPSTIGGGTTVINDYSALEKKVDELIMTMNRQTDSFRRGMSVEMRGMDKAVMRLQESDVRG